MRIVQVTLSQMQKEYNNLYSVLVTDFHAATLRNNAFWWVVFEEMNFNKSFHYGVAFAGAVQEANAIYFGPTYVLPDFRGNGLQKLLIQRRLEHFTNWCEEEGLGICIYSLVDSWNIWSANNLIKSGFLLSNGPTLFQGELRFEKKIDAGNNILSS